jgi:hypothetical protein
MRGPSSATGALSHVVDAQHRVRVAHRQHGHLARCGPGPAPAATARSRPRAAAAGRWRRTGRGPGRTPAVHVHRDAAVGLQLQLEQVVDGGHAHAALGGQALLVHEAHEAARAVAAVLDLVAAGAVEDAVAEVDARRARWARPPGSGRRRRRSGGRPGAATARPLSSGGARGIEHDEVVARALHLGEAQPHAGLSAFSTAALALARAGLEALVHPQVLRRAAADLAASIQRFMRARRPRVVGGPVGPGGRKRTRQPWPPGRISATTGCTTMPSERAMRDGASSVAAGTPKKGTKAASLQAEVHVGQVEEGMAALDGAHQRQRAVVRARRSPRCRSAAGRGAWRRRTPGCSAAW